MESHKEQRLGPLIFLSTLLLHRQLEDKLSGGKYFASSDDITSHGAFSTKNHIPTECDFYNLDQELKEKP